MNRPTTRRRFLATAVAAGAGIASAGALLGEDDPDGSSPKVDGGGSPVEPVVRRGTTDTAPARTVPPADGPVIGANLNGRPRRLNDALELIEASGTTWVRAFIDVREKLADGRSPEADPDVVALRRLAREGGCELIVSLKWDFSALWSRKEPLNVPPPGSIAGRALHRAAARYLEAIGAPIDVVVLGNEPMWETREADLEVEDAPIVRFTRDLKDYLVREGDHGDPTYLVGAFNRAHDEYLRERRYPRFYRQMIDLAREDPDVAGVDLHLHFDGLSEAEEMIAVAREALPDGTIVATEFSPVRRYDRNVQTPIAESEAGAAFAREYGLPDGMTAVEYFQDAKADPRQAEELAAFYEAMPWYNVDHVEDVYALLKKYDASVGTFGFLAGVEMREEDWVDRWTPFHVNFLYQPALIDDGDGLEHAANRHYLEDYRERAGDGRTIVP